MWLTSGVNIKGEAARVLRISSHISLLLLGRPLLLLWQCSASLLSLGRGHQLSYDRRTDFRVRSVSGTLAFSRAMLHSMPLSRSRAAFTWLGLATRTILLSTGGARHGHRQCKGVARVPWNRSEQCSLRQMTVAHDHGYCYLQTKDVSGAAFDGASDGGI